MKIILLTHGLQTLVDDCDHGWLSRWAWSPFYRQGRVRGAARWVLGKTIILHREIMNAPAGLEVDHIDHDTLNNQRVNLRICTHAENLRNRVKWHRAGRPPSSEYKGVWFSPKDNRWIAHISIDSRLKHLGSFRTEVAAALAYDAAAREHYGEFACLNFPSAVVKTICEPTTLFELAGQGGYRG